MSTSIKLTFIQIGYLNIQNLRLNIQAGSHEICSRNIRNDSIVRKGLTNICISVKPINHVYIASGRQACLVIDHDFTMSSEKHALRGMF